MSALRITKRRTKVIALTAALVLAGGATAVAYWTAGGTGSGSAATGSNSSITVVQTSSVTAMGPGIAPQALSGTFNNPNSGPVYVNDVTVTIASITQAVGAVGDCEPDDYTIVGSPISIDAQVPADDTGTWGGATIAFVNAAAENQDGCKNATVNLSYTSN